LGIDDAVRAFAGEDYEVAIAPFEARKLLSKLIRSLNIMKQSLSQIEVNLVGIQKSSIISIIFFPVKTFRIFNHLLSLLKKISEMFQSINE
jgi:hypothetical protein